MLFSSARLSLLIILLVIGAAGAGVALSLTNDSVQAQDAHASRSLALCVEDGYRDAVLASLLPDLANLAADERCESLLRDGAFNPLHLPPLIERVAEGTEPLWTVTVRVVERNSDDYARAAASEFIAISRVHCPSTSCWPVGYDVFVTPEELGTERVDQLVAVGFGTPRDFCSDPTPKWIQEHKGCENGVPTQ